MMPKTWSSTVWLGRTVVGFEPKRDWSMWWKVPFQNSKEGNVTNEIILTIIWIFSFYDMVDQIQNLLFLASFLFCEKIWMQICLNKLLKSKMHKKYPTQAISRVTRAGYGRSPFILWSPLLPVCGGYHVWTVFYCQF